VSGLALRPRLRELVRDRLQLRPRTGKQDLPYFALPVDKKGRYSRQALRAPLVGTAYDSGACSARGRGSKIEAGGPTIFTALREQLGLLLKARRDPNDALVVEQAQN
jgi:hypothetical protein